MKTHFLYSVLFIIILCCAATPIFADESDYWVDLPDEITVGYNEVVKVLYSCASTVPQGEKKGITVTCSDPDAMRIQLTEYVKTTETAVFYRPWVVISKMGDYTLHFSHGDVFSKDVLVHVEEMATSAHAVQNAYFMMPGETQPIDIIIDGGVLYNYDIMSGNPNAVLINEAGTEITAQKTGYYSASIKDGNTIMGSFDVFILDPCENVQLVPEYECGSVGSQITISTTDGNGQKAFAYIEMTDGFEYAQIKRVGNSGATWLICNAPGWVTLTARGTDGSTDSIRMRIYESPSSVTVNVPSLVIAAGEKMPITWSYEPEDTWSPVKVYFNSYEHKPTDTALTGPVAKMIGNSVVGLVPGTAQLVVSKPDGIVYYTITVTDSPDSFVFERPKPYFDWRQSYQLSVHNKRGRIYQATYSIMGSHVFVTSDGLLTADDVGNGIMTVKLNDGLEYSFRVKAVKMPTWLNYEGETLSIPINYRDVSLGSVESDVGTLPSTEWIMCSNDESIVSCSGGYLNPVKIGSTSVTIWSLYCDTHCEVPVTVTGPTNQLYINHEEVGDLEVPVDSTPVKLPTVTDYYGNPVKVTWKKTQDNKGYGNPKSYCLTLNTSKKTITANWAEGSGILTATASSGATIKVYVRPYMRSTAGSFENAEYNIHTGGTAYTEFSADPSTNHSKLSPTDVTFTVTGDTDCVRQTTASSTQNTFVGLKPGTVTLTATLWNGKKYTCVINVTNYYLCENGHDPAWRIITPAGLTFNGTKEYRCTRCGLTLATEEIPCTGELGFGQDDLFIQLGGEAVKLGTNLSGDPKQSFTWRSSDPTIAKVEADRVTGLKAGTATITATRGDCTPATCTIHVINAASITVFRLPGSVRKIEAGAFEGIAATHVSVPKSTVSIGSRAFADCPRLMMISIPASVTEIAGDAFAGSAQVMISCPAGSYAAQYAGEHGIPLAP